MTLLHATASRHEWQTWLRGTGVPDLPGAREQLFDTVDMCVQSTERGLGVAIADAALFTDLIASGKVVKPFDIEVDSGKGYFLTYPPQREQRSIRLFEEWMLAVLRGVKMAKVFRKAGFTLSFVGGRRGRCLI